MRHAYDGRDTIINLLGWQRFRNGRGSRKTEFSESSDPGPQRRLSLYFFPRGIRYLMISSDKPIAIGRHYCATKSDLIVE